MQTSTIPTPRTDIASILRNYSTDEAAAVLKVRPQTIRAGLCRDGHYMGLRPSRLPNRRLLWNAAAVDSLLSGGVV